MNREGQMQPGHGIEQRIEHRIIDRDPTPISKAHAETEVLRDFDAAHPHRFGSLER